MSINSIPPSTGTGLSATSFYVSKALNEAKLAKSEYTGLPTDFLDKQIDVRVGRTAERYQPSVAQENLLEFGMSGLAGVSPNQ